MVISLISLSEPGGDNLFRAVYPDLQRDRRRASDRKRRGKMKGQ